MSSFLLVVLSRSDFSVSLVDDGKIVSTSPTAQWDSGNDIVSTLDRFLSSSPLSPSQAAFIVPAVWIGPDGKIISEFLKTIETVCRQLNLEPLGFISHEEALIESLNSVEGIPVSFVLLHLELNRFSLALVYLGQVRSRLFKQFDPPLSPSLVERTLLEFKSTTALPPQIVVFGDFTPQIITDLQNYPWLGKKDLQAFLHLPEIKFYSPERLLDIYLSLVIQELHLPPTPPPTLPLVSFNEVSPESLGFGVIAPSPSPPPSIPKPKFYFPKLKFPRFKIKINFRPLWFLVLIPPLIFIFLFFYQAHLTLYLNPHSYQERFPITLSTQATSLSVNPPLLPVKSQTFPVAVSASIPTSGQITVGNKAQGEVVIFNQQSRVQNIPKGSILSDSTGKKFELFAPVAVASSSANLDAGIITLGQTKSTLIATDIGPEYNLPKDTKLFFKDYSDTVLLARVVSPFAGGSKRQAAAAAPADKSALSQKLSPLLEAKISDRINQEIKTNPNVIKESLQIKKDQIDYSREVGEEADELTATLNASISLFVLNTSRDLILTSFLTTASTPSSLNLDPASAVIGFEFTKLGPDSASGFLNLTGQALTTVDIPRLQRNLVLKTPATAAQILQKQVNRLYNFKLRPNFILPPRPQNIIIDIKTNSK